MDLLPYRGVLLLMQDIAPTLMSLCVVSGMMPLLIEVLAARSVSVLYNNETPSKGCHRSGILITQA